MKLYLISEATVDQVQRKIPTWAKKYFDGDEQKAADLLPDIIASDPTRGKYSEWLVKQWKDKTARFPEDNEKLLKNLTLFHQKKSKLDEKDIGRYTPGSLAKALDQQFSLTNSERRDARKGGMQLPPGAKLVLTKGKHKVVEITDAKASSLLCSGTAWCVANIYTAEEYLNDGSLFLVYENNERKYLIHYDSDQFMDIYDNEVEPEIKFKLVDLLEQITGINKNNDASLAFNYAVSIIGGRWPEGETAISKNPESAFNYAKNVIGGRWPEGEAAISKYSDSAFGYAKNIIGGRFPEGETAMSKDPHLLKLYQEIVNQDGS